MRAPAALKRNPLLERDLLQWPPVRPVVGQIPDRDKRARNAGLTAHDFGIIARLSATAPRTGLSARRLLAPPAATAFIRPAGQFPPGQEEGQDSRRHTPPVRKPACSGRGSSVGRECSTTRNPMLLFRLSGALSLRYAERQLSALLFHDPPRRRREALPEIAVAFHCDSL